MHDVTGTSLAITHTHTKQVDVTPCPLYTPRRYNTPTAPPSSLVTEKKELLWSLEGQDGEDGSAVHAAHAGTVAHEAQQDGCHL